MKMPFAKSFISYSSDITRTLGEVVGRKAYAGMVITLNGDLGSGKTTFTQGIAKGLDVPPDYPVTSPTYTLINEYPGRYRLFHVDLYRLPMGADLEDIGLYDILGGDQAVVIEWADRMVIDALPDTRIDVRLTITDTQHRTLLVTAYGLEAADLLNGIDMLRQDR